jgi:N-acetyl-anhydromuramyl-L-alanine amidase AmpD
MKKRPIDEIIVHCAATKPSMNIGAEWIRRIHIHEKKWRDIGYHFVIRRNGAIEDGRPLDQVGAHCSGHNTGTIGICMVGGISETGRPENNFTPAQFESVQLLIYSLVKVHPSIIKLSGHNDYANTACPSFNVHEKLRLK